MRRKTLLVLLLAFLIAGTALTLWARRGGKYVCPDCNVILISIDTLRADHLGCYGYSADTTPNIDRFSKDAVLFRTAIAHAPSTTPSHASILTSLLPVHHGALRARQQPISDTVKTMAEILRDAGYRTISFNGGGQVSATYGFDRGFELYESEPGTFAQKVEKATQWMRKNRDAKFFMFLHTYEVHAPYQADARFMEMFDADYKGDLDDAILPRLLININDGTVAIDAEDARHIVNAYDAEIRSMDEAFAQLVRAMDRGELFDNTIVIFTSDHGEEFGEHAQMGRHSHALYDEVLRVPLIIRLPGRKFAGTIVDRQVRGIDILPTVTDLLDLEHLDQFDGASLTPLMTRRRDDERIAVSQIDTRHERIPSSIRTESEKLVLGARTFVEGAAHRWFESKVEFVGTTHGIELPIESFHVPRRVRISVDGKFLKEAVIHPRKQPLGIPSSSPDARVTIESVTPCTRPADVGADLELPCVSFRVFNPFEFFLLEDDPAEQDNRFDDAVQREEISRLRRQLERILASRETPTAPEVDVDPRTRERLRALGYVD
jgi:arylsulfatase A-like enzyme